jgi:glycosyltransferase involved in cell wall biosynthesis
VNCPKLFELPLAPTGKYGWPWTTETPSYTEAEDKNRDWPLISIVIPSFNQGGFIEETIRSILLQGYPNIELIIIDGGSHDNSKEIIQEYQKWISYWVSEPDKGQSHAINKGFKQCKGEVISWQNSDDIFFPGSFHNAIKEFDKDKKIDIVIGNINLIDVCSKILREKKFTRPNYFSALYEGMVFSNQAAFWRSSLHRKVGLVDESLHYAMDYDFFLRLLKYGNSKHISKVLGAYRYYPENKSWSHQSESGTEVKKVRSRYSRLSPSGFSFRLLGKLSCLLRLFGYLKQGDLDYLFYQTSLRIKNILPDTLKKNS